MNQYVQFTNRIYMFYRQYGYNLRRHICLLPVDRIASHRN